MLRFRPLKMFSVLAAHDVRFVVVGMLGAALQGSSLSTGDADICPAREPEDLRRLAAALRELRPYRRGVVDALDPLGLTRFPCTERALSSADFILLGTRYGDLDLVFRPDGTGATTTSPRAPFASTSARV